MVRYDVSIHIAFIFVGITLNFEVQVADVVKGSNPRSFLVEYKFPCYVHTIMSRFGISCFAMKGDIRVELVYCSVNIDHAP